MYGSVTNIEEVTPGYSTDRLIIFYYTVLNSYCNNIMTFALTIQISSGSSKSFLYLLSDQDTYLGPRYGRRMGV